MRRIAGSVLRAARAIQRAGIGDLGAPQAGLAWPAFVSFAWGQDPFSRGGDHDRKDDLKSS
ncbi:MAG TPA: hypothetical protein VMU54_17195 [Planctomycetota bacterium]|nr:hypothetical protein [Planctomycetota bacterium]